MTDPFLDYLERWTTSLQRPELMVQFTAGPTDRPKRAAWAELTGPNVTGGFSVWESGEVEVEGFEVATGRRIMVKSTKVGSPAELDPLLERFAETCALRREAAAKLESV
ncbi:MAG TPA: hypothetical protein VFG42_19450 [Baekduia sp.]|uniref:hypothetical protein n=1 Tax=Baekduia sp. TaxID=2600305 RepID=UPI002D76E937|nr:hypothetical protein [Baekduia sp.]HET6508978.1 hypothetical protein [Baekduia sp.]